jgi:hypothetical protein
MARSMEMLGIIAMRENQVECAARAPKLADACHFEYSQIHGLSTLMLLAMVRTNMVSGSLLRRVLKDVSAEVRKCIQCGVMPPTLKEEKTENS